MWQLIIVWWDKSQDVYEYDSREDAERGGEGMEMANGEQVRWWCVRRKV